MPDTLADLVTAIRSHRGDEREFILSQKQAIIQEADAQNVVNDVKCDAVLKLFYLHMLGYDIDEVAMNCLQLISSDNLQYKRIGYLCASEALKCNTDMILMSTETFMRDLRSGDDVRESFALSCLASIATTDLAEAVIEDVIRLTTSGNPNLVRKAVICLVRLMQVYPEGYATTVEYLKRNLVSSSESVAQTTAVVVCELCRDCPERTMSYLPPMIRMLDDKHLPRLAAIKIIKLMAKVVEIEPRIRPKLAPALSAILMGKDKAVVYEAIICAFKVYGPAPEDESSPAIMGQAAEALRTYLAPTAKREFKYIGLEALRVAHAYAPAIVAEHRAVVLDAVTDADANIRLSAARVLATLCNASTMVSIFDKIYNAAFVSADLDLLPHCELAAHRRLAAALLVDCITRNDFANVPSIDALAAMVADLAARASACAGDIVARLLLTAATQIPDARGALVGIVMPILSAGRIFAEATASARATELVGALIWVAGEYAFAQGGSDMHPCALISAVLHPQVAASLDSLTQAIAVTAAFKIALRTITLNVTSAEDVRPTLARSLAPFRVSQRAEAAQRAVEAAACFASRAACEYYMGDVGPVQELAAGYEMEEDEVLTTPVLEVADWTALTAPEPSAQKKSHVVVAAGCCTNSPMAAPAPEAEPEAAPAPVAAPAPAPAPAPANAIDALLGFGTAPAPAAPVAAAAAPAAPAAPAVDADAWLFTGGTTTATGGLRTVKATTTTAISTGRLTTPAAPAPAAKPAGDIMSMFGAPAPAPAAAAAPAKPAGDVMSLFGASPAAPSATPSAASSVSLFGASPAPAPASATSLFSAPAPAPAAAAAKPKASDDLMSLLGL